MCALYLELSLTPVCVLSDFPPGSVTVNIHCDGIIKATTEIKYCSAAKATESPFRMSEPGKSLDQVSCSFWAANHTTC